MDNIKITQGNAFSLVLPLRARSYTSDGAFTDEDIDATQLTDIVVTFGEEQVTASTTLQGVQIDLPATLARDTYDIVLTAIYNGHAIRAAYLNAVTIVKWSQQSNAEQYIIGSPITCDAAYVIASLTDSELENLKQTYAQKIAEAEQAKEEYEQAAAELQGVAQETTSQAILQEVQNIDIDTTELAKQGTNAAATNTAILEAIGSGGGGGGIPVVQMNETTATIEPNKLYIWGEVASLDITLATPTDTSIVNEYMAMFNVGGTMPIITLPAAVEVRGEMDYNKTICLSIINNIAYLV